MEACIYIYTYMYADIKNVYTYMCTYIRICIYMYPFIITEIQTCIQLSVNRDKCNTSFLLNDLMTHITKLNAYITILHTSNRLDRTDKCIHIYLYIQT